MREVATHTDCGSISLIDTVDEEVSESGVSLNSTSCEQNDVGSGDPHIADCLSELGLFFQSKRLDQQVVRIEKISESESLNLDESVKMLVLR